MNHRHLIAGACLFAVGATAQADVITDWNAIAGDMIVAAKIGTPPANRVIAIVQSAVFDAVTASGASANVDAAVAAANRVTLAKLLPSQEAAIVAAYQAALGKLADGPAKTAGIAAGEKAAAAVLARRLDDGAGSPERYRPHAAAGAYVPTSAVAAPQWLQRKPWNLASPSQFRPGPPPALNSPQWARDYEEVRLIGSKTSTRRSAEQTEIARFWEYSLPPIYHAVLRSVASAPNRTVAQNARLFATAAQAMDDGLIAGIDAKYHYNFWRPATAIRNGDIDGNDATPMEAGWSSLIDAPLHPEYPSTHSILAGALVGVLQAEPGAAGVALSTTSPTAGGASRKWKTADDLAREIAVSRIYAGIHYRTATEVGLAMGKQIGAQAAAQFALAPAGDAKLVERVAARGVQVYECKVDAANGAQWVFVGPQAELFDAQGKPSGVHTPGPHWEAGDGSRIVGKVEARAEAPQAGAIPWLLLSARSVGGSGRYASVTSIQRVNTTGGVAPSQRCDKSAAGRVDKVPYTADYLLYAS